MTVFKKVFLMLMLLSFASPCFAQGPAARAEMHISLVIPPRIKMATSSFEAVKIIQNKDHANFTASMCVSSNFGESYRILNAVDLRSFNAISVKGNAESPCHEGSDYINIKADTRTAPSGEKLDLILEPI
jgi:hypothetical protein